MFCRKKHVSGGSLGKNGSNVHHLNHIICFAVLLKDFFQANLSFTIETRKHVQTYGRMAKPKNKSLLVLSGAAKVSGSTLAVQSRGKKNIPKPPQKTQKWPFR